MKPTVFATGRYERSAKRLLTNEERADIQDAISANPELHPVVKGTGGVRKARYGRQGKGKSGGVRIIYYYWVSDDEVYLLFMYAKNEQADMSPSDRKAAKAFVEELKRAKEEKRR
ncbi:Toxin HigB-2 [Candidatus Sulfopaludibacter sp. SbA4]|nr:Toxin HigB-2 [Candidatus Sulfopaludibacter sp. SbA4]